MSISTTNSLPQAYTNGGGTFLLPCFVMLVLVGIPLVFLELALGQYSACGPAQLFGRMAPVFGGSLVRIGLAETEHLSFGPLSPFTPVLSQAAKLGINF